MKRLTITLLIFILLAIPTGIASAASPAQEIVPEGDTINHDITLIDEDLTVGAGATVNGDVVVFSGNAHVDGTINGDLVVFGGNVTLGSSAIINGDCVLFGGSGDQCFAVAAPDIVNRIPFLAGTIPPLPELPANPEIPQPHIGIDGHRGMGFFSGVGSAIIQTIIMALIAYGTASFVPSHLDQVSSVIRRKPVASGVVGFLTALAVPSFIAILLLISSILLIVCIGILGYPIAFAMIVGFVAAAILGWVALGNMLGDYLTERLNMKNVTLPVTAAFGTAALTLTLGILAAIPYVPEEPIRIVMLLVGLGAAALTKFGRWPYPRLATAAPEKEESKIDIVIRTLPDEDLK